MPILGGNREHKWAYKGDIDALDTDKVHKNYLKSNDIAGQLIYNSKKNNQTKQKNDSFVSRFYKKLSSYFS